MPLNQNHECSNRNEDTGILPWAGFFHVLLAEFSAQWSLLPFTKSSEVLQRVVITAICWVWRLPPNASLLLDSTHLSPISSHCLAVCADTYTHTEERLLRATSISQTGSFAAAITTTHGMQMSFTHMEAFLRRWDWKHVLESLLTPLGSSCNCSLL